MAQSAAELQPTTGIWSILVAAMRRAISTRARKRPLGLAYVRTVHLWGAKDQNRVWAPPRGLEMVVISDFDEPDELPELSDDRREAVVKIMKQLDLASSEMKGKHLTDEQKNAEIRDRARAIRELVSKSHEATL